MIYILMVIAILLLFINIYILRKVSRIDINTWDYDEKLKSNLLNEFNQNSYLRIIESTLKLDKPLPPMRGWAASPDILYEVMKCALKSKPVHMIECSSGISTIILARCAQLNGLGHLISLEHDNMYAEITRLNLEEYGLQKYATVVTAPLTSINLDHDIYNWYSLEELPECNFDLVVIDGPPASKAPQARYPAKLLFDRLNPGANIFLDDANRDGERKIVKLWQEEFKELAGEHVNFEKGMFKGTWRKVI